MRATATPSRPRSTLLTAGALVALAAASTVALLWPALPWSYGGEPPTRAGVVIRVMDDPAAMARIGQPAPDFEWVAPDGRLAKLSDLRGRPVVINFWATWCEPCREEMPALDRAAEADRSLTVLAIDLDESATKVDGFVAAYAIDHLVPVIDAGKKVTLRYGVVSLPSTFFVGRDGVVKHLEIRGMDDSLIQAGLAKAR